MPLDDGVVATFPMDDVADAGAGVDDVVIDAAIDPQIVHIHRIDADEIGSIATIDGVGVLIAIVRTGDDDGVVSSRAAYNGHGSVPDEESAIKNVCRVLDGLTLFPGMLNGNIKWR